MTTAVHERSVEFENTFIRNPLVAVDRLNKGIEFGEGSREAMGAAISNILCGGIAIVYGNHQSFGDGIPLMQVTSWLKHATELPGYQIPSSMTSLEQPLHQALEPIYHARGLYPVGVYTEDELENADPEERRNNRAAAVKLAKGPAEGYGLALFPEADPVGGTIDEDGSILGMQEVVRNDLEGYRRIFMKRYRPEKVFFLPVGINGSYHIYKPETNTPGELAIKAVCDDIVDEPFVTVSAAEPIRAVDVEGDINHVLMSAVAKLLPEEARGFYR